MSISHLDADFVSAIRMRLRRHWGHQSRVFLRRSWDSVLAKAERLALANTVPFDTQGAPAGHPPRHVTARDHGFREHGLREHGLAGGPQQGSDGIEVVLTRTGR